MIADLFDFSRLRRALVYVVYLLLVLLLQSLLGSRLTLLGVHALFLPAAAVAVGMLEDGVWGGLFGLALGILADAGFTENTVLFTVLFALIGFFSGFAAAFLVNRRFFSYLTVSLAALLITALCQMLGVWVSDGVCWSALGTAALQTLWSLPAAALIYFPARYIAGRDWE
ncbi:MAG: hypothetical protein MR033_05315 [Clostridiales bacterium]|nr:hypothetical protein [Clostridiales bacterium]